MPPPANGSVSTKRMELGQHVSTLVLGYDANRVAVILSSDNIDSAFFDIVPIPSSGGGYDFWGMWVAFVAAAGGAVAHPFVLADPALRRFIQGPLYVKMAVVGGQLAVVEVFEF